MTLTEFLLARIAEDEEVASSTAAPGRPMENWRYFRWNDSVRETVGNGAGNVIAYGIGNASARAHIVKFDPARVLAECEAKRQIVDLHRPDRLEDDICSTCASHAESWPCRTLRALALPYADHPDYDEAWRP